MCSLFSICPYKSTWCLSPPLLYATGDILLQNVSPRIPCILASNLIWLMDSLWQKSGGWRKKIWGIYSLPPDSPPGYIWCSNCVLLHLWLLRGSFSKALLTGPRWYYEHFTTPYCSLGLHTCLQVVQWLNPLHLTLLMCTHFASGVTDSSWI